MIRRYKKIVFGPSNIPTHWYKYTIMEIYKLLLKDGEKVISCKPVSFNGTYIFGLYDISITQVNQQNPSKYRDGTIANRIIRLHPSKASEWDIQNKWKI